VCWPNDPILGTVESLGKCGQNAATGQIGLEDSATTTHWLRNAFKTPCTWVRTKIKKLLCGAIGSFGFSCRSFSILHLCTHALAWKQLGLCCGWRKDALDLGLLAAGWLSFQVAPVFPCLDDKPTEPSAHARPHICFAPQGTSVCTVQYCTVLDSNLYLPSEFRMHSQHLLL